MVTVLVGLGFVIGTIVLAWAVYFATRLLAARRIAGDTKDLAGSVIFRVAALHGLILALVFARELLNYQQLRSALVDEATAIANIYNDIRRYGGPQAGPVREALSQYARNVTGEEWSLLAREGRLSADAWSLRETVYLALLDLVAQTPRDEALRLAPLFRLPAEHGEPDPAERLWRLHRDRHVHDLCAVRPVLAACTA